ncbi:MAG: hypothetical protein HY903_22985 [Deltaproteobacteria bacterium]|nr:hypothetical protein [Deltaproteobacteria bacterium]
MNHLHRALVLLSVAAAVSLAPAPAHAGLPLGPVLAGAGLVVRQNDPSVVEGSAIGLLQLNGNYVRHNGLALAASAGIVDFLAIEALATIPGTLSAGYTDLVTEVYEQEALTPEGIDLKQASLTASVAAKVVPVYGTLRAYGASLAYRLFVIAGGGIVGTKEPCRIGREEGCSTEASTATGMGLRTPPTVNDTWRPAANIGVGLRVDFSELVGLRAEVRDVVYSDHYVDPSLPAEFGDTTQTMHLVFLAVGVAFFI